MSPANLLAALGAAATVWLLFPPRALLRSVATTTAPPLPVTDDPGLLRRLRPVLAPFAALAGWLLLGGAAGVAAGIAAGALTWRVLGTTEPPSRRRRREELERNLPIAVHLIAAGLAAGAAPDQSLGDVAEAVGGAVGQELRPVRHRLALGEDPIAVWRQLAAHPDLGRLGRAFVRAHESGVSVRMPIERLAHELNREVLGRAQRVARTIEVRAAAPLGLCLLPAFVLVGIVPLVATMLAGVPLLG